MKLWTGLFTASAVFGFLLHLAGFPAAFLIGPMIVAMLFAVRGANLAVPRPYLLGSQAIVGCLVARALDPSILITIAVDWPAMLLVVATTVVASTFAGWMIARTGLLPGPRLLGDARRALQPGWWRWRRSSEPTPDWWPLCSSCGW